MARNDSIYAYDVGIFIHQWVKLIYTYLHLALPTPTCSDNTQNQDETHIDCGGSCPECNGRLKYHTVGKPFIWV